MEDGFHCNSDGLVVGVDRFWVVRRACWVERLSGGQEGFDSFVSEYEQRSHRSEPSWKRLVAAGSGRPPPRPCSLGGLSHIICAAQGPPSHPPSLLFLSS